MLTAGRGRADLHWQAELEDWMAEARPPAVGIGEAPRDWTPGGQITVGLDGKTYEGRWFHIPSDKAVLVERWGEPALWPDPVIDEEMTVTAEMLLITGDTDKLRCQLRFNLRAHRGTGTCKALTGGFHDLRFESD